MLASQPLYWYQGLEKERVERRNDEELKGEKEKKKGKTTRIEIKKKVKKKKNEGKEQKHYSSLSLVWYDLNQNFLALSDRERAVLPLWSNILTLIIHSQRFLSINKETPKKPKKQRTIIQEEKTKKIKPIKPKLGYNYEAARHLFLFPYNHYHHHHYETHRLSS